MGTDDKQTEQATSVLVPTEQDTVPFYGHNLVAVRLPDGRIAAVLRWLCEGLSLSVQSQLRHIQGRTALAEGLVPVRVDTAGGPQTMPALTLDVLPGWLFSVDERRVKEEARADVVLFQRECVKVLADHFTRKHQALAPIPADATAATAIVEQIADLTGVVNLLRDHLEALLGLPGQIADLSTQVGETRALVESLAERQGATESQVAKIEARTQRLTPAHARAVQEQVDRMVRATQNMQQPLTYVMVYGRLKHKFRAGSYSEISDERFEEVMAYLREELQRATGGETPEQGNLF